MVIELIESYFGLISIHFRDVLESLSSQSLVYLFSALILICFFRYYFTMKLGFAKTNKFLLKNLEFFYKTTGTREIKDATQLKKAKSEFIKTLVGTALKTDFEDNIEDVDVLSTWKQISANVSWVYKSSDLHIDTEFAQGFLNENKVLNAFLAKKIFSAPTVLTSLGIIGTFLGLTMGVGSAASGLASPDISIARQSMSNLLNGAQLAFVTSLLGLSLALLYRLILTKNLDIVRKNIQRNLDFFSMVFTPKHTNTLGNAAIIAQLKLVVEKLTNESVATKNPKTSEENSNE
jgi:hypothetical protein